MDFQRVRPLKEPARPLQKSPEGRYWRRFRNPIFVKESQPIVHVHFAPRPSQAGASDAASTDVHGLAVTSGARVSVYSNKTHRVTKTIARFKETAYCAEIRADGRLAIAGDASGLVQIFDLTSRAILRTLKGHQLPVHVTKFSYSTSGGSLALTASDDKTLKLWDVSTGELTHEFLGHQDYIRAATFCTANTSTLMSASYDGTVKLWDSRVPQTARTLENTDLDSSVMTMRHGFPVEAVLAFPSGSAAVSSGGPLLRQWDLVAGGKCLRALSNHQKTVTSLAFDCASKRLLSGSLDQMVKVWDVSTWKVVHGMRYTAPILDVAMSSDGTHIAAGMANGLLSIRYISKKGPMSSLEEVASFGTENPKLKKINPFSIINASTGKDETPRPGTAAYFQRTLTLGMIKEQQLQGQARPFIIASGAPSAAERNRRRRLKPYDKLLRSFRHAEALDAVLPPVTLVTDKSLGKGSSTSTSIPARTVASVILELIHRGALRRALEGRDEHGLEAILRWSLDQVCRDRFDKLITIIMTTIVDLYGQVMGQSQTCARLLLAMRRRIAEEMDLADDLKALAGKITMVSCAV